MPKAKNVDTSGMADEIELPGDVDEFEDVPTRRHEVLGVITSLFALILLLALFSYDGIDAEGKTIGENIVGPMGTSISYWGYTAIGATIFLVEILIWVYAFCLFVGKASQIRIGNAVGILIITLLSSIALHTIMRDSTILGHAAGGILGALLGELSISMVSTVGTYILTFGGTLLILLLITDISLYLVGRALLVVVKKVSFHGIVFFKRVVEAWKNEDLLKTDEKSKIQSEPETDLEKASEIVKNTSPSKKGKSKKPKIASKDEDLKTDALDLPDDKPIKAKPIADAAPLQPKIVTSKPTASSQKRSKNIENGEALDIDQSPLKGNYKLPPLSFLAAADEKTVGIDKEYLTELADRLVKVLADFNIKGEVKEIHPGPVVTMYEFQPKSGTKLSKIEGLSNEIAMALEVLRVRVVAPIPGKNAVGFELPNKRREMVRLREILEADSFALNKKAKLPMALGKDIAGSPYTVDLAKMPHLLMAGTTGSGKSVSVNTMLVSMLYRYTPEDLRMLLIDPKMIEFQPYNHIPHLLLPVVTDMDKACLALKWAVDEMERRYQLFADCGSRNLESYNNKVSKILLEAEAKKDIPIAQAQTEVTENGVVVEFGEIPQPEKKLPEKLPLIVICIDELADLMMVAAKDVETSIARLAQKARAAGLHLIVATQRPSTDVVTGLIKANFPTRLSCQVSSGIDSRTILGSNGAENLLGNGDMLIMPPGTSSLVRVQGAFVTEEEVADIVDFLKAQGLPTYDDEILKPREDENNNDIDEEDKDEMYDQAVAIVAEAQACSISMIQRKLRIGYNRSARIVEIMEKEGIIGPANGVNKREVLISPQ